MLKHVESPWPLAQVVYQHHERMNGSGYPRNLKGDEILIEARILAVSDVVESMASHGLIGLRLAWKQPLKKLKRIREFFMTLMLQTPALTIPGKKFPASMRQ